MENPKQSWTRLQMQEGPALLDWLESNEILAQRFDTLAKAFHWLLEMEVRTAKDAIAVCKAVPAAYKCLNNQSVYENLYPAISYIGLHLLDRYVRTWLAMVKLVEACCLPLAKYGVNVLDSGTGPGPSAFAVHDFYAAITKFSEETSNPRWHQPANVFCVEKARVTNHLRHLLGEMVYELSQRQPMSVLAMCHYLPEFKQILPMTQRKSLQRKMSAAEDYYLDEDDYSYDYEPEWPQKYRLLVFSNFLTDIDTLTHFETNLSETFIDASPGTTIMLLGGKKGKYPQIYARVGQLARSAGFKLKIRGNTISWANNAIEAKIRREGERFYQYLQNLAPTETHLTNQVRSYFQGTPPSSQLWAYRKYTWKGRYMVGPNV